jgi:hypothetical protein
MAPRSRVYPLLVESAWLTRVRWRHRGAWLWPAFAILTLADAVIGHALPPSGESQSLLGAMLAAVFLNLIAIVLLSVPFGAALRRARPDMPRVVARDYGGTTALLLVSAALLVAGAAHRPSVVSHRDAMHDAISRAQAWIGDRAPAEYRRNIQYVSAVAIEPGSIYRMCVPSINDFRHNYCVIVKTHMPFTQSVRFDGHESNADFSRGTG